MWSILTAELNSIGPPSFTDVQWKAKWSQHKYNKKRKRENDDEYEEVTGTLIMSRYFEISNLTN